MDWATKITSDIITDLAGEVSDEDLTSLFEYAVGSNNRTILAALFMRGYTKGKAPSTYHTLGLYTASTMRRLSPEVLQVYLDGLRTGDGAWQSVSLSLTPSWWSNLWSVVAPMESQCRALMALGRGYPGLYQHAANVIATPTESEALALWPYSQNPLRLVAMIPLETRIKEWMSGARISESAWFHGITWPEVLGLMLAHRRRLPLSVYSNLRGPRWSAGVQANLWCGESFQDRISFLNSLSQEDVEALDAIGWMENLPECLFYADILDYGQIRWLAEMWVATTDIVRVWWAQHLYPYQIRAIYDHLKMDIPPQVYDIIIDRELAGHDEYAIHMAREKPFTPANVVDLMVKAPAPYVYDVFKGAGTALTRYHESWRVLGYIAADRVPSNQVVGLALLADNIRDSCRGSVLTRILERATPEHAQELRSVTSTSIYPWMAQNAPIDTLWGYIYSGDMDGHWDILIKRNLPDDLLNALANRLRTSGYTRRTAKLIAAMKTGHENWLCYPDLYEVTVEACARVSQEVLLAHVASIPGSDAMFPVFTGAMRRDDVNDIAVILLRWILTAVAVYGSRLPLDAFDDAIPRLHDTVREECLSLLESVGGNNVYGMQYIHRVKTGISTKRIMTDTRYTVYNIPLEVLLDGQDQHGPNYRILLSTVIKNNIYEDPEWLNTLTDEELDALYKNFMDHRTSHRINEVRNKRLEGAVSDLMLELTASWEEGVAAYCTTLSRLVNLAGTGLHIAGVALAREWDRARWNPNVEDAVQNFDEATLRYYMAEGSRATVQKLITWMSDDMFDTLFPDLVGILTTDASIRGRDYRAEDHEFKAALALRANPQQSIALLEWFFENQQGIYSRVVHSILLAKLEDDGFCDHLKRWFLSDKFNLRTKQFTTEMVPFVEGLADRSLLEYFNRSSRFRGHALIGPVESYRALTTDADRVKYLSGCRSRALISILTGMIDAVVPLTSPVKESFGIGTNDPIKVMPLLQELQVSVKTTTHGQLLKLAVQAATDDQIRDWILTNPFRAFEDMTVGDPEQMDVRLDTVPDEEAKEVIDHFNAQWTGAGRNITQKVLGVYKVVHPRYKGWETKHSENVMSNLYHGTDYRAVNLIINNHFKVMVRAKTGRAFGDGVYFADCGSKAAQYMTGSFGRGNATGCMFVCDVDLGNCLHLDRQSDRSNSRQDWYKTGFDSIHWPKQGTLAHDFSYGGRDAEYIVRDVSRINIRYVLHLERHGY